MVGEIIFKTKKIDKTFLGISIFLYLFLILIASYTFIKENDYQVFIPIGIIIGIIFLLQILTYYQLKIIIKEQSLYVHLFFTLYKVEISKITKIRKGETMWSGFHKYGNSAEGLIIFAKSKEDLYITPENEELFFKKILEINPNVIIEMV